MHHRVGSYWFRFIIGNSRQGGCYWENSSCVSWSTSVSFSRSAWTNRSAVVSSCFRRRRPESSSRYVHFPSAGATDGKCGLCQLLCCVGGWVGVGLASIWGRGCLRKKHLGEIVAWTFTALNLLSGWRADCPHAVGIFMNFESLRLIVSLACIRFVFVAGEYTWVG